MGTTVDDLIDLKDNAVGACYGVVAAWEAEKGIRDTLRRALDDAAYYRLGTEAANADEIEEDDDRALFVAYRDLLDRLDKADTEFAAVGTCREVVERAELYDAADESEAVSIQDYEENYAPEEVSE